MVGWSRDVTREKRRIARSFTTYLMAFIRAMPVGHTGADSLLGRWSLQAVCHHFEWWSKKSNTSPIITGFAQMLKMWSPPEISLYR